MTDKEIPKYVGSNYDSTVALLREQIVSGLVTVLNQGKVHRGRCYFCLDPIDGVALEIISEGEMGVSRYIIDKFCYASTKFLGLGVTSRN